MHDECTVHAKEQVSTAWTLPGENPLRLKSDGRLIHVSSFIVEASALTGRLALTDEQWEEQLIRNETLDEPDRLPRDAQVLMNAGSSYEGWWDMKLLKLQMQNAISLFEIMFPGAVGIWTFDNSSSHGAFSEDALRINNMNLGIGGGQKLMHETIIPSDDPLTPENLRGRRQSMIIEDGPASGKAKGIAIVLKERGLWDHYTRLAIGERRKMVAKCRGCKERVRRQSAQARAELLVREHANDDMSLDYEATITHQLSTTAAEGSEDDVRRSDLANNCCWTKILSQQSDFLGERNQLQNLIEGRGHVCVFLPKYHCELNSIEYYWAWVKSSKFSQSKCVFILTPSTRISTGQHSRQYFLSFSGPIRGVSGSLPFFYNPRILRSRRALCFSIQVMLLSWSSNIF